MLYQDSAPRLTRLWDFRDAHLELSTEEIRRVVHLLSQYPRAQVPDRIAIVTGHEVDYGMARLGQVYIEDRIGTELVVFREMEEAESWLHGE